MISVHTHDGVDLQDLVDPEAYRISAGRTAQSLAYLAVSCPRRSAVVMIVEALDAKLEGRGVRKTGAPRMLRDFMADYILSVEGRC